MKYNVLRLECHPRALSPMACLMRQTMAPCRERMRHPRYLSFFPGMLFVLICLQYIDLSVWLNGLLNVEWNPDSFQVAIVGFGAFAVENIRTCWTAKPDTCLAR